MGRWLEYRRNGSSGNWRSGNLATVSQARGELWAEVRPCEIQQSEGTEEQSRSEPLADPVGQVWPEPVGPSPMQKAVCNGVVHADNAYVREPGKYLTCSPISAPIEGS
jgi:hypothetical protein